MSAPTLACPLCLSPSLNLTGEDTFWFCSHCLACGFDEEYEVAIALRQNPQMAMPILREAIEGHRVGCRQKAYVLSLLLWVGEQIVAGCLTHEAASDKARELQKEFSMGAFSNG